MKSLLVSVASAALILPLAACSPNNNAEERTAAAEDDNAAGLGDDDRVPAAEETRVADETTNAVLPAGDTRNTAGTDTTMDNSYGADNGIERTAYLGPNEISAKELLGEEIYGADNPADTTEESIAHVDDLLIDADNKVTSIVYVSGGVAGVGGTKSTIPYNKVGLSFEADEPAGESDPEVRVSMTDDQARAAKEFDQAGMNDYRLASEIIGSKVDLASTEGDDDDAVINDLVLAKDGTVKQVIVQASLVGSIGAGDLYAFDFGKLGVAQGDGGDGDLFLNVTEQEMNDAKKVDDDRP